MSAKEVLIEMIRKMPDDATIEDVLYMFKLRAKVAEGIRQCDAGESIPHNEVPRRLPRWFGVPAS